MKVRGWVVVAIAGLTLGVSSCGEKPSGGDLAKLVEATGGVTVNGASAGKGMILSPGDEVAVARDGLARVQFADGTRVLVFWDEARKKRGVLRIKGTRVEGDTAKVMLKLSNGILAFLVPPKRPKPKRFEIEGSTSITAIHGTEGKIVIEADGDLIALKDGKVIVRAIGGGSTTLTAGQSIVVKSGQLGQPEEYNYLLPSEKPFYTFGVPDVKTF